ncbi:MAG TPA: FecR domain-containing protein [Opitutaceae bacterium]|nr:FecR domain-containing protein [Opitutaceae bacterium]
MRPSIEEAIEATAAAWLAERDDDMAADRAAEFARWRDADPRHEAAIARLEAMWGSLQQLREFRPEAARHPDRNLLAPNSRRRIVPFPAIVGAGLAAAIVLVAGLAGWGGAPRGAGTAPERHVTTIDGYERLTLEDGSVVELNANSEINVRFTPAARQVTLVRGEAHFTVAKNPARPFTVGAGSVVVRAVGTAFNVRLGSADVEVLVTEGKVELNKTPVPAPTAAPAARTAGTPLGVNERAVIPLALAPAAVPLIQKISPAALHQVLAWQGPPLVFTDAPLAEVIAQFNRRNVVQMEIGDGELQALPVGGSFRAENVEAFVRLIENGNEIVVERPAPGRIVLRKQK